MWRTDIYIHRVKDVKPDPPPHVMAAYEQLEKEEREASRAVKAAKGNESGSMGLPPEHIRQSPEYRNAKANYERAFQALRNFNQQYANQYNWRKFR